jgi:hypothetical protein
LTIRNIRHTISKSHGYIYPTASSPSVFATSQSRQSLFHSFGPATCLMPQLICRCRRAQSHIDSLLITPIKKTTSWARLGQRLESLLLPTSSISCGVYNLIIIKPFLFILKIFVFERHYIIYTIVTKLSYKSVLLKRGKVGSLTNLRYVIRFNIKVFKR